MREPTVYIGFLLANVTQRLEPDERTRRQVNNLRHATNSELLCEAFLHAFTGQPLPGDEDLRKDRPDDIPESSRAIMELLGKPIEKYDE